YTLWSLERMAVLYDLPTIMGKDWYRWGAQFLLVNQQADGSWQGTYPEGGCDTAFAVLFLKRANVAADLTERIKKDPYRPKFLEAIQESAPKRRSPPPGEGQKQGRSSLSPPPRQPDQSKWSSPGPAAARPPRPGERGIQGLVCQLSTGGLSGWKGGSVNW